MKLHSLCCKLILEHFHSRVSWTSCRFWSKLRMAKENWEINIVYVAILTPTLFNVLPQRFSRTLISPERKFDE